MKALLNKVIIPEDRVSCLRGWRLPPVSEVTGTNE